jgi:RNA polymerase sigma-70 factor (ECF subfamily)
VKAYKEDAQSDAPLLAQARSGNAEAFSELVWKHSRHIYGVSLRILKNHEDAEDNLQNVFCKVYKNLHRFEGRSRFSTWLVRIAINEALMKIRRKNIEHIVGQSDLSGNDHEHNVVSEIEDRHLNPELQYMTKELATKAFQHLHPSLRKTFFLNKVEGWTHSELAGTMGITVATVKSRIFRARARMHQRLQAHC